MGFIWFLLAVTFFILWLSKGSGGKNRTSVNDDYERGYAAGLDTAATTLKDRLRAGDTITEQTIQQYVQGIESNAAAAQPVAAGGAVLFPEERGADDAMPAKAAGAAAPAAVAPSPAPAVIEAPVAPKRTKAEQTNRNLNILLYAASFLIIAAAAAFIATSTPAGVRLVSLWAVIMAFYIVGLFLHARFSYLRPAATAFVGTGLALIPFAGIALSQLGGLSGGWAWAITSVIGVLCYGIATVRLTSNVVAYLTLAFSLSLATSTVAVVEAPMVYYFVVLIVVSLLFHLAARVQAKWIPSIFKRPITQAGHLLTPLTLLGSILAFDTMTLTSYQIVFWVATLYYAVILATDRRYIYEAAVRILLTTSIVVSTIDIAGRELVVVLWVWLALLVAQGAYSLWRVRSAQDAHRSSEIAWYWSIIAGAVVPLSYWALTDIAQTGVATQVLFVFVISVAMAWRLRSVYFAIPALFASVALPFIIGRWPGEVGLSAVAMTYIFLTMSAAALAIFYVFRSRSSNLRVFLQAAFWLYSAFGLMLSMGQESAGLFALSTSVIAALVLCASYLYRRWGIEIVSLVLVVPVVWALIAHWQVESRWLMLTAVGLSVAIYATGAVIHGVLKQTERRNAAIAAVLIAGLGLAGAVLGNDDGVRTVAVLAALAYIGVSLAARLVVGGGFLRFATSAGYLAYPIVALLAGIGLEAGWYVGLFAVAAAIYWGASYIERNPAFLAFGNLALIGVTVSAWSTLKLDNEWFVFGVAWLCAVVYYASYIAYMTVAKDTNRSMIQIVFTWVVLGLPTLIYFFSNQTQGYAAAATLAVIGGTVAVHGILLYHRALVEVGIYLATFALQRYVGLLAPELNSVLYGHWWAITIAAVAYWRRTESAAKIRLIIAMLFVTGSSGLAALDMGGFYQLLFLVEHVILLVVGALTRVSWALWWGLVATVLAVLYFLKSSLFLSLLFLGLTLLAIVIWRLVRAQRKNKS